MQDLFLLKNLIEKFSLTKNFFLINYEGKAIFYTPVKMKSLEAKFEDTCFFHFIRYMSKQCLHKLYEDIVN